MTSIALDQTTLYPLPPGWTPATPIVTANGPSTVLIEGKTVCCHGSPVESHRYTPSHPDIVHSDATLIASQSKVKVGGVAVCIDNDPATCNATHIVKGSSLKVMIV